MDRRKEQGKVERGRGEAPQQQLKNVCGIQKGNFKIKGWPINSQDATDTALQQSLLRRGDGKAEIERPLRPSPLSAAAPSLNAVLIWKTVLLCL